MKKLMISLAAFALFTGCGHAKADNIDEALSALSLLESETGPLSYAEKTVKGRSVTFKTVGIKGQDDITIGALTLDGLDISDGAAAFDRISLSDIRFGGSDLGLDDTASAVFIVDYIAFDRPSDALVNWFSSWLNGQATAFPAANTFAFDGYVMKGLRAEVENDGQFIKYGVETITMHDIKGAQIGHLAMKDMSLAMTVDDGEPLSFSVTLADLDIVNLQNRLLDVAYESDAEQVALKLVEAIYGNPIDPGHDGLTMNDFQLAGLGLRAVLPSVTHTIERDSEGQLLRYVAEPYSFTVKTDRKNSEEMSAVIQDALDMVGYKVLQFNVESALDYDPDKDIATSEAGENYIALVDGARLAFGVKAQGLRTFMPAFFAAALEAEGNELDAEDMLPLLSLITLHNFEIQIGDDGLLDRALNAYAAENDIEPDIARAQLTGAIALMPMGLQDSGIDSELISKTVSALIEFVSGGKTLALTLDPPQPLSLADMIGLSEQAPETIPSTLGLDIGIVEPSGE